MGIVTFFKKIVAKRIKDDVEREKQIATLNNEPWVKIVSVNFEDTNDPGSGYFELDWNQQFIEKLIEAGYSGRTDSDVVDMWFNSLCHGVIDNA